MYGNLYFYLCSIIATAMCCSHKFNFAVVTGSNGVSSLTIEEKKLHQWLRLKYGALFKLIRTTTLQTYRFEATHRCVTSDHRVFKCKL